MPDDRKEWSPDQKLRHDATDEQIAMRFWNIPLGEFEDSAIFVAREFAKACVEASPSAPLASGMASNFNSGKHRPWAGARLDASEAVVREAMREYTNCAAEDGHPLGPDAKETLRRICNVALAKWREEWYDAPSPPSAGQEHA